MKKILTFSLFLILLISLASAQTPSGYHILKQFTFEDDSISNYNVYQWGDSNPTVDISGTYCRTTNCLRILSDQECGNGCWGAVHPSEKISLNAYGDYIIKGWVRPYHETMSGWGFSEYAGMGIYNGVGGFTDYSSYDSIGIGDSASYDITMLLTMQLGNIGSTNVVANEQWKWLVIEIHDGVYSEYLYLDDTETSLVLSNTNVSTIYKYGEFIFIAGRSALLDDFTLYEKDTDVFFGSYTENFNDLECADWLNVYSDSFYGTQCIAPSGYAQQSDSSGDKAVLGVSGKYPVTALPINITLLYTENVYTIIGFTNQTSQKFGFGSDTFYARFHPPIAQVSLWSSQDDYEVLCEGVSFPTSPYTISFTVDETYYGRAYINGVEVCAFQYSEEDLKGITTGKTLYPAFLLRADDNVDDIIINYGQEQAEPNPNPIIDDFSTNDCQHWTKVAGSGTPDCSSGYMRCSGDCSEGLQMRSDYLPINSDVNVSLDYSSQGNYIFVKRATSDDLSYVSVYYDTYSSIINIYDNTQLLNTCPITLDGNDNVNVIFKANGDINASLNGALICSANSQISLTGVDRLVLMSRWDSDGIDNVNIAYNQTILPPEPPCTPDWSCTGYETCVEPMVEAECNAVLDLEECGEVYGGDYSEFSPSACVYPPVITGYVPLHNATDIPAVTIDSIVEVGLEYIKYAGLIAIVGLGVWAMVLI